MPFDWPPTKQKRIYSDRLSFPAHTQTLTQRHTYTHKNDHKQTPLGKKQTASQFATHIARNATDMLLREFDTNNTK